MSRTIRRKGNTPKWAVDYPQYHCDRDHWKVWLKPTKWHTNWKRRSDERQQLNKAFHDNEYDFVDYEKLYKGIVWCYD